MSRVHVSSNHLKNLLVSALLLCLSPSLSLASSSICSSNGGLSAKIACWNFNSKNGQFIPDLSGNGYHAIPHGEPKYQEGVDSSGMQFNTGSYLKSPLTVSKMDTASFSVSLWINTASDASQEALTIQASNEISGGGNLTLSIAIESGEVVFTATARSGAARITSTDTASIDDGEWHHIALTREGIQVLIYVDGKLLRTSSRNTSPPIILPGDIDPGTYIGGNPNSQSYLDGRLDDIAIFNRVLTGQEILTIYQNTLNRPPVFTSIPVTSATEHQLYTYSVTTSDPDGDPVTLSLVSGPVGMQLNNDTLTWTPGDSQVGTKNVVLRVTDDDDAFTNQIFSIQVANVNDTPSITSSPPTHATEGLLYQYQLVVSDPDPNETLSYSMATAPSGLGINSTGLITWTPEASQAGLNNVSVVVTDLASAADTQSFQINVSGTNSPPSITTTTLPEATEDVEYNTTLAGNDPEGSALSWALLTGPSGMTINSETGELNFTADNSQTGYHVIEITVTDGIYYDTAALSLTVFAVNDPPQIDSTVPQAKVYSATVFYSVPLSATDEEGNTLTWSLAQEPAGVTLNGAAMEWTPDTTQQGLDTLLIMVSDGESTDTLIHYILVTSPPTSGLQPNLHTQEFSLRGIPGHQEVEFYIPNSETHPVILEVYAGNGQKVLEKIYSKPGTYQFSLPQDRGLYFIRFHSKARQGRFATQKLVY